MLVDELARVIDPQITLPGANRDRAMSVPAVAFKPPSIEHHKLQAVCQFVPVRKQGDETLEVDLAKQMFVAVTGSLALERDRGAGEKNRVGCEGLVVLAKGAPALHLGCGLPVHRKHILQTRLGCCMIDLRQRCG